MVDKEASEKWIFPSTIIPKDIIARSDKLMDSLINETELERELSEILTLKHPTKRRKTQSLLDDKKNDQTLVELAEELLRNIEPNLQNSLLTNNFESEEDFMKIIRNIDNDKVDIRTIMHSLSSETPAWCIEYFIVNNYFSISDLINALDDVSFEVITFKIMKINPRLCRRILGNLAEHHNLKFIKMCTKILENPPEEILETNCMSSGLDLTSSLLLTPNSTDITCLYSNLLELYSDQLFQSQISQLSAFLQGTLKQDNILDLMKNMLELHTINHRYTMILWSTLLKEHADNCTSFLSELCKTTISKQQKYNFTLFLILTRSLEMIGIRNYSDSYQTFFGNSSTHITSSKDVDFVLRQFINLVPHEIGVFLKHHIHLPLRGGAKYKDKLEQYMILAKTRLKDFSMQNIDKNVISDVKKSITSFGKKNTIPSSILEASIFKKQYYTSHFLPCLLYDKNLEDSDDRSRLIAALKAAKKIPNSVLSRNVEVEELSASESIQSMIDSLPTADNASLLGDRIYRLFCVSFDKQLCEKLIRVVCEDCPTINSVSFLKPFHDFHKISSLFVEVTGNILCATPNCDVLELLELFSTEKNQSIIKDTILNLHNKNKNIEHFVSLIPVSIESDFLHIIVLGKISSEKNTVIPLSVWEQIDILRLCETLEWWPQPNLNTFHMTVETIMDNIVEHQSPNSICMNLFMGSLKYNILPLISPSLVGILSCITFSKLWIYQGLATGLLPLYQTPDKPVSLIRTIFKRFFNTVNIIQPTLLFRSGTYQNMDNLCSVLDSYKIYITNDMFVFKFQIILTIIRSMIDHVELLNVLCKKSPTFVLSCVYHSDKMASRFSDKLLRVPLLRSIVSTLKDRESAIVPTISQETTQTYIGILLLLQNSDQLDVPLLNQGKLAKEGYIAALFHHFSRKWINGTLTPDNFLGLGKLFTANKNIVEKHILIQDYQSSIISTHFDGYRTNRIFPLLYLGGLAGALLSSNMALDTDSISLCRKSYQQVTMFSTLARLTTRTLLAQRALPRLLNSARAIATIPNPAPAFTAQAVVDGQFKEVSLADYTGKYVILFFYPLDFTFVCPTEITAFSDRAADFEALGCQLLACSVDSHFSHLAWTKMARSEGGLGEMKIPILADLNKKISADYGVLLEGAGIALRGLFIIDPAGKVRHITINDLPIGRSVDETMRLLKAIQFTEEHGEVCPANWSPGASTIKPGVQESKEFFEKEY